MDGRVITRVSALTSALALTSGSGYSFSWRVAPLAPQLISIRVLCDAALWLEVPGEMRFCHESHHHLGALFSVVCPNYLPIRCQNKYTRHDCLLVFCSEFAIDYALFYVRRSTSKSSSNGSHQTSPAPRRRRPHGGGGRGPVSGPAGGLLHRTQVPRVERGARRGGARLTHARRRSRVTCVPRTCSSSGMIYFLTVGTRPVIRRVRTAPPRPWNPID